MQGRTKYVYLCFCVVISCFFIGCSSSSSIPSHSLEKVKEPSHKEKQKVSPLLVYVCGGVQNPGVYEMKPGDRKIHGIEKAGGFREDAMEEALNLAEEVTDGERIYVPVREETSFEGEVADFSQGKININRAGKEELMKLEGVGDTKAAAIIKYRQEHGMFQNPEDIRKVSGIGEKLFEKIRESIEL